MKRRTHKFISLTLLIAIILFGFFLRWYQLGSVPEGALIDEAHFGYIAYSLLETGADEHGISFPLVFKGFGDQKLPLAGYVLIPVVKFFGLSNLTIRIPSLIAGVLIIVASYLLVWELPIDTNRKQILALFAAFIAATAPWTFILSRFGFESNLALCLFSFGLLLLLKTLRLDRKWLAAGAGICLALTWYSYIAYRPITFAIVLLAVALGLVFKHLSKQTVVFLLVSFCVLIIPWLLPSTSGANTTRFNQVGIFSDPGYELVINEGRAFCSQSFSKAICYTVWNKPLAITTNLISRYVASFSPEFLFTFGEAESGLLSNKGFGQFYWVYLPFYLSSLVAVIFLLKNSSNKSEKVTLWLLIFGLLITPIPTVLVGVPQVVRLSAAFPFLLLAIVIGLDFVLQHMEAYFKKAVVNAALLILVFTTFFYTYTYVISWLTVQTQRYDLKYQSYVPGIVEYLENNRSNYDLAYIKPFYSDPLMFYAYYTQMNPELYQDQAVLGVLEASGFQHTVELGHLRAFDYSIGYVGCLGRTQGLTTYLVTDIETQGSIIHRELSANGVDTRAYIYDASGSVTEKDCEHFNPSDS